jgi:hypothetical protein
MSDVMQRLEAVRGLIARAIADSGRRPDSVDLVAVSKTIGAAGIAPALAAGQRVFGENYVQETQVKWPALRDLHPDVRLHMIGPLQSNKAQDAVRLFDVIQTIDRESLAKELAKAVQKQGRAPQMFVQVNTGYEPQKGGVLPPETDAFVARCRTVHGLNVVGLMCIPPADAPPSPHFALLNTIAARNGLPHLSMGMSADFEAAIQLGATHVRVGSAIFGSRA